MKLLDRVTGTGEDFCAVWLIRLSQYVIQDKDIGMLQML